MIGRNERGQLAKERGRKRGEGGRGEVTGRGVPFQKLLELQYEFAHKKGMPQTMSSTLRDS